jgi:thermitase
MNIRRVEIILSVVLAVFTSAFARAEQTNSLIWNAASNHVTADIHGEPLWPLLEDIAHQTGWHIFVEPRAQRVTSVKFRDLPTGEALPKLLGDLNFAMVPQTNGPDELYVFTTTRAAATQRVEAPLAKPSSPKHVPNELVVKLKPGANIDELAKSIGAKVIARNDKLGIYRLQFGDAAATDAALANLKNNPDVAAVEYNYLFDPPTPAQQLANAPSPPVTLTLDPNTSTDTCHPVVGLIDTGVQSLGSQLDPFLMSSINVSGQTNVLSNTGLPTHGTAMAETILRAISQQSGSSGIKILPVDVYGSGETASTWNVALGVQAAVDGGATVLNMSLSGTQDSAVLDSIIQQALAKGVVIFAAAGNQPVDTATYPAAIPGVNAVTALGAPGQLASYANFGSFVEMALPGSSIVYLGNQAYVVQGTSPATAYASGVAAGARGLNCLPWDQIESTMTQRFPVPQK